MFSITEQRNKPITLKRKAKRSVFLVDEAEESDTKETISPGYQYLCSISSGENEIHAVKAWKRKSPPRLHRKKYQPPTTKESGSSQSKNKTLQTPLNRKLHHTKICNGSSICQLIIRSKILFLLSFPVLFEHVKYRHFIEQYLHTPTPLTVLPAKAKENSSVIDLSGSPTGFREFDDDSELLMSMDVDNIIPTKGKKTRKYVNKADEFDDDVNLLDVDPDLYVSSSRTSARQAKSFSNQTTAPKSSLVPSSSSKSLLDAAKNRLLKIQNKIKNMFDNFQPVPKHLAEAREKLLNKWQELSKLRDTGPSTPSLVQKLGHDSSDDTNATESPGTCKHCGKPGHYKFECPQLTGDHLSKGTENFQTSGFGTFSSTGHDNDRCFKCNQLGHWASNCPNDPVADSGIDNAYAGNGKSASLRQFSEDGHGDGGFSGKVGDYDYGQKIGACHKCGKEGHWAAECPASEFPQSTSGPGFEYKATKPITRVSSSTAAAASFWADANKVNPHDCPFTTEDLYTVLRETFGHRSFRECQLEVVQVSYISHD